MFEIKPEWRTSTVCAVAAQIRSKWDCSYAPLLADALTDAGCDDDNLLILLGEGKRYMMGSLGTTVKARKHDKNFRILIESLSNYTHPDCPDELREKIIRALWDGTWKRHDNDDRDNWSSVERMVSMQMVPGEPIWVPQYRRNGTARVSAGRTGNYRHAGYYITGYKLMMPHYRLMRTDGMMVSTSIALTQSKVKENTERQFGRMTP